MTTPAQLCSLTQADIDGSARYMALPEALRAAIDRQVTALCAGLNGVWATLSPVQQRFFVGVYGATIQLLAGYGLLTEAQVVELKADASGLLS